MSHNRREALWRVVAFLWSLLALFILQFVLIFAFVWGLVDVILELVTDRDFLMEDSSPAMAIKSFIRWPVELLLFAFTGHGGMMWTPDFS